MSRSFRPLSRGPWPRLLLMIGLLAFAGCRGCGSDATVETDNTVSSDEGWNDLESESLGDRPFDEVGSALEDSSVQGEELPPPPVKIELEDVFFAYDQYELDAEDRAVLARNARLLREHPQLRVLVEGHCDERGTAQYNMALGEKRAKEVARYLQNLGIAPDRIDTVSYGKERPFAVGSGEAVWSQNRRAHFVVRGGR